MIEKENEDPKKQLKSNHNLESSQNIEGNKNLDKTSTITPNNTWQSLKRTTFIDALKNSSHISLTEVMTDNLPWKNLSKDSTISIIDDAFWNTSTSLTIEKANNDSRDISEKSTIISVFQEEKDSSKEKKDSSNEFLDIKKQGFVTFLDILGYSQMLTNNKLEEVIKIVQNLKLIQNKIVQTKDIALRDFIDIKNISDSIVITINLKDKNITDHNSMIQMYFEIVSSIFYNFLCEGLPLRGGISFGEYYFDENIIAGNTIIEAYKIEGTLNFSGLVLDKNIEKKYTDFTSDFKQREPIDSISNTFGMIYDVPVKNSKDKIDEKHYVLNWMKHVPKEDFNFKEISTNEIVDTIFESFHKHNKSVTSDVDIKIRNTERIVKYMLLKNKGNL